MLLNPRDEALIRFSAPTTNTDHQRLAAQMTAAKTAYVKAFLAISKPSKAINVKAMLESSTEMDLATTAMNIMAKNPQQQQINKFVDCLHHYHGVFDVLSQADFSYLTLIWGGIKLVLIVRFLLGLKLCDSETAVSRWSRTATTFWCPLRTC